MRAIFYTEQGPAASVLQVGEQPTPAPGPGEVRVRLKTSGVNPSDWKVRRGGFGRGLAFPLIIPHSDGADDIDAIGAGIPQSRIDDRVWIWNGQWKRPFGTAAEYIVVPSEQAVSLHDGVAYAEGAGFDVDTNIVTIFSCDGRDLPLPRMTKAEVAQRILDEVLRLRGTLRSKPASHRAGD